MKSIKKLSHDDCQLLLPTYLHGKLNPEVQLAVQQHIARCSVCFEAQQEAEEIKKHYQQTPSEIEDLVSTSAMEKSLDKTLAAIDKLADKAGEQDMPNVKQSYISGLMCNVREQWDLTPFGMKGIMAAQAACVLAVIGLLSFLVSQPNLAGFDGDPKTYQTLSQEQSTIALQSGYKDYQVYRVVFHGAATESNIRSLMNSVEGQIISGPSVTGFYTVVIPKNLEQNELILNSLRQSPWIKLAEPAVNKGTVTSYKQ